MCRQRVQWRHADAALPFVNAKREHTGVHGPLAAVTDARVLAGDSRGNIAYLTTRTAAQAALAIEKLEQQEVRWDL